MLRLGGIYLVWWVLLVCTVWSSSQRLRIPEILTLGHNLTVLRLIRACWNKFGFISCDEYYLCAWVGARPINSWFPRFWMSLIISFFDEYNFCADCAARPINYWFPRFWLSFIISLFEILKEDLQSWWFLLAVMTTTSAHGVERVPSIPNCRYFDSRS